MRSPTRQPKKRAIAAALTGVLAGATPLVAKANCGLNGTISSNSPEIGWSSGNCTINPNVTLANFQTATALLAVGVGLGTLTNNGTIAGSRYGFLNAATIGTVINNGTIVADRTNAVGLFNNSAIGKLTNTGTISAGSTGIFNPGSIGTLTNTGLINGSGGFGYTLFNGIRNTGTITVLENDAGGMITGGSSGIGNQGRIGTLINSGTIAASSSPNLRGILNGASATIGTLTNNASGTISGGVTAIFNLGVIGTLTNAGIIDGGTEGVVNTGQVAIINNTGTMEAQFGLTNFASIGSLINSGTLMGNAGSAVALFNQNTGTISGLSITSSGSIVGRTGISNAGILGPISNSGLITGSVDAINNSSSGTLGTLTNSGVIAGNITNLSTNDLNINGAADSSFGTLTGIGGAMGTISSASSNVNFGSGNLLLDSNINVGSNAVNNAGTAVLQVNRSVAITGNYTQGVNATLLVGVADGAHAQGSLAGDSGYGRLVVSGSANVAANSNVTLQKLNAYGFAAGQRFVVIDAAAAGTNYNADHLTYSIAGGAAGLVVNGAAVANGASNSDLVLTVANATSPTPTPSPSPTPTPTPSPSPAPTPTPTPSPTPAPAPTPTPTPATVPNARAALGGLQGFKGINDLALLNLYNASLALSATGTQAEVNRAGKQLAPTSQSNSSRAAAAPTFDALNVVSSHVNGLRLAQRDGSSGISTGEGSPNWGVWGQAFGGHASQDERDQIDGFSSNYAGLIFGVDRAVSDAWRVGGAFSYSNAAINNTGDTAGDNTRVNSYGLIGYASYTASRWYANLSVGAVQQRYDTNRAVDFSGFAGEANGAFNGQQYVARGEVGYPIALGVATVTPLATLTYSYLHQSAYTESGGNGAALSVNASHLSSVTTDFGARLEREFATSYGTLVPELTVAWRHEYNNTNQLTNATFAGDLSGTNSFTVLGTSPVTNSAIFSAGVTLLRERNLSVTARYELQAGGGFLSQGGTLRLRQLF
jgi:outer membrane autotransporter protein